MRTAILAASLLCAAMSSVASATVVFDLRIDPPTTAFSGIARAGGFTGASTRSGAGTWHLYATDTTDGSLGIANYSVQLSGGVTGISHRSPLATTETDDGDLFRAGFFLGRTLANANPIQGSQAPTDLSPLQIFGFGREASNFAQKIPSANLITTPVINGQWGNYATDPFGANWLFLAEGTYSGTVPSINPNGTSAQIFTGVDQFANVTECFSAEACLTIIEHFPPYVDPEPPIGGMRGDLITTTFTFQDDSPSAPYTWELYDPPGPGNPGLVSFVPMFPGDPLPAFNGQIDPSTGVFSWNTTGFPAGAYTIAVSVGDNEFYFSPPGHLVVTLITPEPSSLALLGFAIIGALGIAHRRR